MENDTTMGNRKISVIILTKNNGSTIREVLRQIHAQETCNETEIIVVDSGSSDDTIEKVSGYNVRFYKIPPGEFGHGRTRNLASGYASGDYLVYISADAIPVNKKWLENLVKMLDIENVAATFGRQIPYEDTPPMERFFISRNYPPVKKQHTMTGFNLNTFFSNVNSAIKRSVWDELKFNEELIISEDHEWAKRVYEKGYKIEYIPEAAVFHSHNYGLQQVFKRYFDSGVSFSQMKMKPQVLRNGIGYFIDEITYIGKESSIKIPYAICYDFSKFLGFFLGRCHMLIPRSIKIYLSMHSYYWKSE